MKKKIQDMQSLCIPLLDFQGVTVVRGGKKILNNIVLRIYPGEHVAILGPNGAGKSSLIKTITKEFYPLPKSRNFSCKIWGQDRWNVFNLRSTLGIVSSGLQDSFACDMTGMEAVLSGFFSSIGLYQQAVTKVMRRKARNILYFLEIAHLKDRKMTEMSSGEARRFLIGRALVHEPKALILDEPANSLDLHARHKFSKVLGKIAKSGVGIIIVTHNLSDIIPAIARVVLVKKGRIFKDGPKRDIITDKNMSQLFKTSVKIKKDQGYYYAV